MRTKREVMNQAFSRFLNAELSRLYVMLSENGVPLNGFLAMYDDSVGDNERLEMDVVTLNAETADKTKDLLLRYDGAEYFMFKVSVDTDRIKARPALDDRLFKH